ncbi:MAG TPA: cobalamin biosynthesis protein [Stenomitos sp.]
MACPLPSTPTRILWLGFGCNRGVSHRLIDYAVGQLCQRYQVVPQEIVGIATLERKAAEAGLLAFSQAQQWPLSFYAAADLQHSTVPHPSLSVALAVGVWSVAEAAALTAAHRAAPSGCIHPPLLLVPKQKIGWTNELGTVTLAIAQVPCINSVLEHNQRGS